MKKLIIIACILSMSVAAQAQQIQKRLDSLMNYYYQTLDFNGMAYVVQKGKVLLDKGYGYKDRYKNLMNDNKGIYMIGSITKQFTAEIILLLASEHKLSLQDKLDKYFPGYPSGDKITIENLLTHTSGIYNYTEADTMWEKHPGESATHEQRLSTFRDKPMSFEPGTNFEYSNSNYILLGYIIEQVTGKSYYAVVREKIIQPLGMHSTGFDYVRLKDGRKVKGYNCIHLDSFYSSPILDSTLSAGAGSLYSTAEDMYKWHRALQDYKILPKEWQEKAYKRFKKKYGYGWVVPHSIAGRRIVSHSGGINGYYTYIERLPEEDVCIILLKNVQYLGADNAAIAKDIVKCLYDPAFKVPAPRKEIALTTDVLGKYEGQYFLDSTFSVRFKLKGDHLYSEIEGQGETKLFPEGQSRFFIKEADAQFEFVKNEDGDYSVWCSQNGGRYEGKKKL